MGNRELNEKELAKVTGGESIDISGLEAIGPYVPGSTENKDTDYGKKGML
ncbi:MAG: bacteriocin [Clostridia bacterium]|nr:bacteriocin [Clostridia bacterium]